MPVTLFNAVSELERRALPHSDPTRNDRTNSGEAFYLSGPALRDLVASAGVVLPDARKAVRKAAAAKIKVERTPEQKLATELRKRAWDERHALGMTYAQACAHFGVTKARG